MPNSGSGTKNMYGLIPGTRDSVPGLSLQIGRYLYL